MSLSTTQYGYIVDPMVPFTDDKGKTIKNGYIRVFMAGTSTPVLTYRNYDGATNQEKIELDNSGRVKHNVIGSKGSLYKVVVYDAHHSQETPILTVDKIAVLGASINATGATIVTGLDSVTVQEENFLKATVEGTDVELALDPTEVTSDVSTISDAATAAPDYVVPLLEKTGTGDGKKISLANLFKFALDWISRLATTVTSFASGDFIAVSNTTDGSRKMSKDTLLQLTAQNALAGNVAPAFNPAKPNDAGGYAYYYGQRVIYEGKVYKFKKDKTSGAWDASFVDAVDEASVVDSVDTEVKRGFDYPFFATTPIPQSRNDYFVLGGGSGASFSTAQRKITIPIGASLSGSTYLYTYFQNKTEIMETGKSYKLYYLIKTNLPGIYNLYFRPTNLITETARKTLRLSADTYLVTIDFTYVAEGEFYVLANFSSGTYTEDKYYQILKSGVIAENANNVVLDRISNVPKIDILDNKVSKCFDYPYFATTPIPQSKVDNFLIGSGSGVTWSSATRTLSIPIGAAFAGDSYLYTYFENKANILEAGKTYKLFYVIHTNLPGIYNLYIRPSAKVTQVSQSKLKILDNTYLVMFEFTYEAEGEFYVLANFSSGTYTENKYYQILKSGVVSDDANFDILKLLDEYLTNSVKTTTLTVGVGKTYTSLRTALEYAASIASATNRILIEFYGGGTPYEIRNDITDADLANSSFIGLIVPDYVKIKGMGGDFDKNVIQLTLESDIDTETRRRISTLNTYQASELENLTIIGTRTRYAVHDDYASAYNVERTMRNLHVIAESTVLNRPWGAGYRSGCTWNFIDCIFENLGSSYAFSAHNTNGSTESAILNFENCRFITTPSELDPTYDRGVCFGSLNNLTNGVVNYISMKGCAIDRVVMYEESAGSYGAGIKTRMLGFGNTVKATKDSHDSNTFRIIRTDGIDYWNLGYVSLI